MIHPDTELRLVSPTIGFGVFATRFIPRGTITWVRDPLDLSITPQQFEAMPRVQRDAIEKYVFADATGNYLLCWDLARFVNHSCEATCRNVEARYDVAVRDILAGEEITSDYAELNIAESFTCLCASPLCRGTVGPGDRERLQVKWQTMIADVTPLIRAVVQPLGELEVTPRWR